MREIWLRRRVSRVEIADSLGLNKSTVTTIVNELIDEGVVESLSIGEAGPSGGRKPVYLGLNGAYGTVLGIEIRPESYTAVGVDMNGHITFSRSERQALSGSNLRVGFEEILARIQSDHLQDAPPLLGIGVGLSGVVDAEHQIIRYSIPLRMSEEFDFKGEIADGQSVPVFPENDANCCAWGELAFHRADSPRNFLFVLVEFRDVFRAEIMAEKTAVGMGIIIDGAVYRGSACSAGEFRSILRSARHSGQFSLDEAEVSIVDTDASVRSKFIRELSRNLALLVNTFNLDAVVLGGDIERYQTEVTSVLTDELERNWAYPGPVECEIRFSSLGDRAVAYGAAGMMLDRLFTEFGVVDNSELAIVGGVNLTPLWNRYSTSR